MAERNYRPIVNTKKVEKLEEISRKFDLPAKQDVNPIRREQNNINVSDIENHEIVADILKTGITSDNFKNPNIVPPIGRNGMDTRKLFNQRKYYKDYAIPMGSGDFSMGVEGEYGDYRGISQNIYATPKYIDMTNERTFYGKVDACGCIVYPSENALRPAVAATSKTPGDAPLLINFVAEAYVEMHERIKKLGDSGKISTSNSNYYPFKADMGWASINEQYHTYINFLYEQFTSSYLSDYEKLKHIRNFDDWMKHFILFTNFMLSYNPITRTNFILKREVRSLITGLVFVLKDKDSGDDKKKYEDFFEDVNFKSISEIAKSYGFFIDKNAPWRFVANLNSKYMTDKMNKCGYSSVQDMFDKLYYKSYLYDMEIIQTYLLSFYNSFVNGYPITNVITSDVDTGVSTRRLIRRYPIENLNLTDKQMLAFYYYIRAKEASKDWDQGKFDYEVTYMAGIYKSHGIPAALKYIDENTRNSHYANGNPSNRYRIQGKNRIYDNPNSTKDKGTYTFVLSRY